MTNSNDITTKTIKREEYLERLRNLKHKKLIKILTGIRRCGKSTVLEMFKNELLKNGVDENQIIFINFEDLQFSALKDELALYDYIKSQIKDNQKYYLFFDEIQNVANFEKAINSFRLLNTSIFITGSNAKLLSGELATVLSGRYVSFRILPFTFKEALEIQGIEDADETVLMDYIRWGGMHSVFL